MINPNTKDLKGPAGQDFLSCSNHSFSNSLPPGVGPDRPAGTTHLVSRPCAVVPPAPGRAEHLGISRAPRKPRGEIALEKRLLRRPRPLQCNLGGFSRSLPASFRAQPLPPRRLRAREGGWETRGLGGAAAAS